MKAFISYSHQDKNFLDLLHKHFAQLQRDNLITTWTDRDIMPGGKLDANISAALSNSKLFIALLSPDYIASNYCYEKEFKKAQSMQDEGLIIIPIVVEPCDWLSTPFKEFKALPTDGKAISTWENKNTAFLDVIQNIRKLIENSVEQNNTNRSPKPVPANHSQPRNYRVQKDFDSIEKMEFVEKTFYEVKEYLNRFLAEITQLENIKSRVLIDEKLTFECLLVNRNKIATESTLKFFVGKERMGAFVILNGSENRISYSISGKNANPEKGFSMMVDEYHLFWAQSDYFGSSRSKNELSSKDIADIAWSEWLETVGIL